MERPGHRSSDNLNTSTTANAQQQQRASITIDQLPRLPDGKIELPRRYDEAPMDALVELIADMLQRLIVHNDQIPLSPEALTRFHSRSPPAISVLDYLRRIVRYANVERTCLLITLHYIDQICARMPQFTLSSLTAHRFVIAAVVVASKALCDAFCLNAHYARVGGIRVGELNVLERELLSAIDWRLTSTREVLDAYYVNLVRTHSSGTYALAPPSRSTSPASPTSPGSDSDMDSIRSTSPQDSSLFSANSVPISASTSSAMVSIPPTAPPPIPAASSSGSLPLPAHHISTHNTSRNLNDNNTNQHLPTSQVIEPSTVLISRATLSPRPSSGPTLEQNMAFASLRNTTTSIPSGSHNELDHPNHGVTNNEIPSMQFSPSPRRVIPIPSRASSNNSGSPSAGSVTSRSPHSRSPFRSPLLFVSSRRNSAYEDMHDKRVVPQRRSATEPELTGEDNVCQHESDTNGDRSDTSPNGARPRRRPKLAQEP